jgi:uncharacterized Zn finger protein
MRCFECGSDADHMHHVVPKSRGGTMTVPLCVRCHGKCHGRRMTTPALTKAALAAKRRAGQRTGEVPFGWTVDDAGNLVAVAEEQVVLDRIHALRDAGVSMNRIAAVLTEAGILTKKGRTKWYAETIRSILDRAAALAA